MDVNVSERCFTFEQQRLYGSELEALIFKYFFPPICAFGILGNGLNMLVFFSAAMKSRAKTLLATMAVCDIVFLLLMIPHSLANFDHFAHNYNFRRYYLLAKTHLITFANWNSAVAIWIMVAVCTERVMGIREPFRLRARWPTECISIYIMLIIVLAGCLTFYNHFSYICFVESYCQHTQVMARCIDITRQTWLNKHLNDGQQPFQQSYVRWSIIINAVFVAFIPTVLLAALNISLMLSIKERSFVACGKIKGNYPETTNYRRTSLCHSAFKLRCNEQAAATQRIEHRIAITVCAIVTAFTLTQAPSAVILSLSSLMRRRVPNTREQIDLLWHHLYTITSFLVVVGKALNFILFCLSSSSFRKHLLRLLRSKIKYVRQQSIQHTASISIAPHRSTEHATTATVCVRQKTI